MENVLNPMIQVIAGDGADIKATDLKAGAEAFLQGAGMTEAQLSALEAGLSGK